MTFQTPQIPSSRAKTTHTQSDTFKKCRVFHAVDLRGRKSMKEVCNGGQISLQRNIYWLRRRGLLGTPIASRKKRGSHTRRPFKLSDNQLRGTVLIMMDESVRDRSKPKPSGRILSAKKRTRVHGPSLKLDIILWTGAEACLVSIKDWNLSARGIQRHEHGTHYLPNCSQQAGSSLNYLAHLNVLERRADWLRQTLCQKMPTRMRPYRHTCMQSDRDKQTPK